MKKLSAIVLVFCAFCTILVTACGASADSSDSEVKLVNETTRKSDDMKQFEIHVIGQITSGGFRKGYLITIDGSDAVYIFNNGEYTPFLGVDGKPVIAEDLE